VVQSFDRTCPLGYFSAFGSGAYNYAGAPDNTALTGPFQKDSQDTGRNESGRQPSFRSHMTTSKSEQPANFEAALAELEKIVLSMESGKLSLEQSLAAHKRGLELAQYCQSVLSQAQQQVKVLEENTLKNLPSAESQ
jgi:exodeoxyribonuclease VII small subunit